MCPLQTPAQVRGHLGHPWPVSKFTAPGVLCLSVNQFNSIQFKSNRIKSNQIKSIQFNSIQNCFRYVGTDGVYTLTTPYERDEKCPICSAGVSYEVSPSTTLQQVGRGWARTRRRRRTLPASKQGPVFSTRGAAVGGYWRAALQRMQRGRGCMHAGLHSSRPGSARPTELVRQRLADGTLW